ncbi:MAG: isopentenyl phosphate kinase [Candidatus Thermoplasmatota archaeon]|nr:isopentenyl phosphate kinase [Candidatus Thermoplasmatota archaeon]
MVYLIKLGGSVITDKTKLYEFREATTMRLAKELKESARKYIIVHGAGSFGHIKAKRYNLDSITKKNISKFRAGIAEVQYDVRTLNLKVIKCLSSAGLNPVSVPPSMVVKCENKKIKYFNDEIFRDYIRAGLTPVTFGDVVLDEKLGFCICSGDLLMLELAKKFKFEKAIFLMDVDGFYSGEPKSSKLIPELTKELVTAVKPNSKIPDVTGGAYEKMRISLELARHTKTIAINGNIKNRLKETIEGKPVIGTKIKIK